MENEKFIRNSIRIHAPAMNVWDALVNPEQTKKYMFGCEAISDWKPGSSLLWRAQLEGEAVVYVTGKVVEIEPGRLLAYTVFDPNSTMEDIPENHLTVTYALTEENGETLLSVSQGDYARVAEGERRYQESLNGGEGWNPILAEIKKLVEG